MKILHTSDWHLGKCLDKYSRLNEQALFIDELEDVCNKEEIDLIIIAGDVYDTINPSSGAEKLFYNAMKRLSLNGERPIVIIAGNHDSPSRLFSPTPIMNEFGIFIKTDLETIIPVGNYKTFKITRSGGAFIELEINNERAVIVTVPYITEKLLNLIIFNSIDEKTQQQEFSDKVKILLDDLGENFSDSTINILMMHLFAIKGIETDSERKIQTIGGTYAVDPNIFPEKAQYVALGHLHKQQKVSSKNNCISYYSGSPIAYSKKEANSKKGVIVLDIRAKNNNMCSKEEVNIKKIELKSYKPIYLINSDSCDDAIKKIEELDKSNNNDGYIYLEIFTDKNISPIELSNIRGSTSKDIVSILINSNREYGSIEDAEDVEESIKREKSITEHFKDFYTKKKNYEPSKELLEKFEEILLNEADKS